MISVSVESGGVAVVLLDRPEKRNALSIEMRFSLAEALSGLASDPAVGAVVVTGAGSAFCSGMDVTEFGGSLENRRRIVDSSLSSFGALGRFPKPAVAAVNGPAVAGGFALALLCDVRVAGASARLGFGPLPPGVPASYASARAALPAALARELCLTGRVLAASEAAALGVVSEVIEGDCVPRAVDLARAAACPAGAAMKRRILAERQSLYGRLFDDEAWELRKAVLGAAL